MKQNASNETVLNKRLAFEAFVARTLSRPSGMRAKAKPAKPKDCWACKKPLKYIYFTTRCVVYEYDPKTETYLVDDDKGLDDGYHCSRCGADVKGDFNVK